MPSLVVEEEAEEDPPYLAEITQSSQSFESPLHPLSRARTASDMSLIVQPFSFDESMFRFFTVKASQASAEDSVIESSPEPTHELTPETIPDPTSDPGSEVGPVVTPKAAPLLLVTKAAGTPKNTIKDAQRKKDAFWLLADTIARRDAVPKDETSISDGAGLTISDPFEKSQKGAVRDDPRLETLTGGRHERFKTFKHISHKKRTYRQASKATLIKVRQVNVDRERGKILIENSKARVQLYSEDMWRLNPYPPTNHPVIDDNPKLWLNDSIINLYLYMVAEKYNNGKNKKNHMLLVHSEPIVEAWSK
ncbi:hypothetical protein L211DRAFT_901926 [Terfezia boudieri ATCC MYA-4762]|uniref:Uncharacterized protein n=1 Tax=Terfezia boudieri ATCC MYA-4762 TaxID=1051890 RepID=A0A3N4L7I5_9PEZI|nr:hypothetical protein L211DRAFT_901926 [Terfezia boudieri ATCC MYA-4762]